MGGTKLSSGVVNTMLAAGSIFQDRALSVVSKQNSITVAACT